MLSALSRVMRWRKATTRFPTVVADEPAQARWTKKHGEFRTGRSFHTSLSAYRSFDCEFELVIRPSRDWRALPEISECPRYFGVAVDWSTGCDLITSGGGPPTPEGAVSRSWPVSCDARSNVGRSSPCDQCHSGIQNADALRGEKNLSYEITQHCWRVGAL